LFTILFIVTVNTGASVGGDAEFFWDGFHKQSGFEAGAK
jgi:hypothetical protein